MIKGTEGRLAEPGVTQSARRTERGLRDRGRDHIDAKAALAPGTQEVDAFVREEFLLLEESKDLFPKKNFRGVGVDVGNGNPALDQKV